MAISQKDMLITKWEKEKKKIKKSKVACSKDLKDAQESSRKVKSVYKTYGFRQRKALSFDSRTHSHT